MVKFNTLQPFIPSGADFEASKQLFMALGFQINWENGGYIGFQRDNCSFILQDYTDKHFAENLMMRLTVNNLDDFWHEINGKDLTSRFNIKLKEPTDYPYGREMHLIDIAGVCWHIAQSD
jgi:hypothetical protein